MSDCNRRRLRRLLSLSPTFQQRSRSPAAFPAPARPLRRARSAKPRRHGANRVPRARLQLRGQGALCVTRRLHVRCCVQVQQPSGHQHEGPLIAAATAGNSCPTSMRWRRWQMLRSFMVVEPLRVTSIFAACTCLTLCPLIAAGCDGFRRGLRCTAAESKRVTERSNDQRQRQDVGLVSESSQRAAAGRCSGQ